MGAGLPSPPPGTHGIRPTEGLAPHLPQAEQGCLREQWSRGGGHSPPGGESGPRFPTGGAFLFSSDGAIGKLAPLQLLARQVPGAAPTGSVWDAGCAPYTVGLLQSSGSLGPVASQRECGVPCSSVRPAEPAPGTCSARPALGWTTHSLRPRRPSGAWSPARGPRASPVAPDLVPGSVPGGREGGETGAWQAGTREPTRLRAGTGPCAGEGLQPAVVSWDRADLRGPPGRAALRLVLGGTVILARGVLHASVNCLRVNLDLGVQGECMGPQRGQNHGAPVSPGPERQGAATAGERGAQGQGRRGAGGALGAWGPGPPLWVRPPVRREDCRHLSPLHAVLPPHVLGAGAVTIREPPPCLP